MNNMNKIQKHVATLMRLHWNYARAWQRDGQETDFLEGERIENEIVMILAEKQHTVSELSKNDLVLLRQEIFDAVGQPNNPTSDNRPKANRHFENVLAILANAGITFFVLLEKEQPHD